MIFRSVLCWICVLVFACLSLELPAQKSFRPGSLWLDTQGHPLNAHGGSMLYDKGIYYWFGEARSGDHSLGVSVYSSQNLYDWRNEGLALEVLHDTISDIQDGCILERPKVLFNKKTGKYVMWIHLELKGQGYAAARVAVAIADNPKGPYRYLRSFRPNGHMSRDMTLFQDSDNHAYEVYSSNENWDLRVSQLSDDYLNVTTKDSLLFSEQREAPVVFYSKGFYYLINSGCTGWRPNAARLYRSKSIWGPWEKFGNPMQGKDADLTFGGQPAFVFFVQEHPEQLIFVGDLWNPSDVGSSRYFWLPISFNSVSGLPVIAWSKSWNLQSVYK